MRGGWSKAARVRELGLGGTRDALDCVAVGGSLPRCRLPLARRSSSDAHRRFGYGSWESGVQRWSASIRAESLGHAVTHEAGVKLGHFSDRPRIELRRNVSDTCIYISMYPEFLVRLRYISRTYPYPIRVGYVIRAPYEVSTYHSRIYTFHVTSKMRILLLFFSFFSRK
jgi:hypothetical protein